MLHNNRNNDMLNNEVPREAVAILSSWKVSVIDRKILKRFKKKKVK